MNEQESELLARRQFNRGCESQREGRIGDAIAAYLCSLLLHPTPEAHTHLGWTYSTMGRYEDAIEQCHCAIALDPDYGNPYNDIGAYLIAMERWDEAQSWLELALSAPRFARRCHAHYHLGRLHQYFGRYQLARAAFRAALDETPNYQPAERALMALVAAMN